MTADNDHNAADPFSATFRTAPQGRAGFRFTSFGDLATPNPSWVLSYGIREEWLPLFDRYQVDLVLNGHDHDYERSFPVRGADTDAGHEVATGAVVNTLRPHPVTTIDSGVFDTSQGTVHLILGCGGTDAPLDEYGTLLPRQAKVFTRANRPVLTSTSGVYARAVFETFQLVRPPR